MSLICGVLSPEDPGAASMAAVEAMLSASPHRGRDGRRTLVDPDADVALGCAYTATLGRPKDNPPWHEDGQYVAAVAAVAAVDGEVYGTANLIAERSEYSESADAGALLYRYVASPTDSPAGIEGTFSFFFWDRSKGTLTLATDPFGRRLLYYHHDPARNLLVFSTELKSVLAHPSVSRELDRQVLPLYLAKFLTPSPFTLAKGVRKLQPAECLTFGPSGIAADRYWRPHFETGPDEFDYWVDLYRAELLAAVSNAASQAESVGVYLSGGLDSPVVLGALKEANYPLIRAFTLANRPSELGYDLDEAARIADLAGTEHQAVKVDAETDVRPELVAALFAQLDEPFFAANRVLGAYFLGRAALDSGINSVLTGALPGHVAQAQEFQERDRDFDSRTLEEVLSAAFSDGIYIDSGRLARILAYQVEGSVFRETMLANEDLLHEVAPVRIVQIERRLRGATGGDLLFSQYISPLIGVEERAPFGDTRLSLLNLSQPVIRWAPERPADRDRVMARSAYSSFVGAEYQQQRKQPFPRGACPSWIEGALLSSLKVLSEDGIVTPDYTLERAASVLT